MDGFPTVRYELFAVNTMHSTITPMEMDVILRMEMPITAMATGMDEHRTEPDVFEPTCYELVVVRMVMTGINPMRMEMDGELPMEMPTTATVTETDEDQVATTGATTTTGTTTAITIRTGINEDRTMTTMGTPTATTIRTGTDEDRMAITGTGTTMVTMIITRTTRMDKDLR